MKEIASEIVSKIAENLGQCGSIVVATTIVLLVFCFYFCRMVLKHTINLGKGELEDIKKKRKKK